MAKGRVSERVAYIATAAFFGVLLLIGTFFDEAIAKALFLPKNVPATLVTTTGIYPFFASIVFFMGAAFQRATVSKKGKAAKIAGAAVSVVLALVVGFFGSWSLLDIDCLGGILPSLDGNTIAIVAISVVLVYPLFYLAYRLAKRSDDPYLVRKIIGVVVILAVAFILMKVFKKVFNRPRYRTVALGYEGINFVPWYQTSPDPSAAMERYGLDADEFASFPSGHAILSMASIYILYSLAWFFPKLKGKRLTLCLAGFLFATVVMFTRMVLGAHYLSDVSAGALIGFVLLLAYDFLQRRIQNGSVPA